jgi:type IV pilus assembly protein PilE
MIYLTSTRHERRARRANGFTLIEVMITVVIIGILASIAYPSYMSQVRKSRRSEAVAVLSQIQQAQERWRANCPFYAGSISAANSGCPATPGAVSSGLGIGAVSDARYTYALSNVSGTTYTLTATAITGSSQAGDTGCTTLTVAVTNGTAANGPAGCWSK